MGIIGVYTCCTCRKRLDKTTGLFAEVKIDGSEKNYLPS